MTQAYVMQLHWTEEAMRRAQGELRTETYEFREWVERRKVQEKIYQGCAGVPAQGGLTVTIRPPSPIKGEKRAEAPSS